MASTRRWSAVLLAPWLLLSAGIHAVAIGGLLLLPGEQQKQDQLSVRIQYAAEAAAAPVEVTPLDAVPEAAQTDLLPPAGPALAMPGLDAGSLAATADLRQPEPELPAAAEPRAVARQWTTTIDLGGTISGRYAGRSSGRTVAGASASDRGSFHAIELGLDWLRRHQDDDGRWDGNEFMKHDRDGAPCTGPGNALHDVGITGLALLAFLGDGSRMQSGPYRQQVKQGVKWLWSQQQDNGLFGSNTAHDFVYDHAIAAYAMCEAYGLSGYATLRRPAQRGIDYLERHRNPGAVWRYQPRDGDNDTSITGWCILCYSSGRSFGLQVDPQALRCCSDWLDQVTDEHGRAGYRQKGEPSSRRAGEHETSFPVDRGEAMTAEALFCRFFLAPETKEQKSLERSADLLLARPPVWDRRSIDEYYWYYASSALYQLGGRHWSEWQKKLADAVVKNQRQDGNARGSWDPLGVWAEDGGRIYSTAMLVLTLEAGYRYQRR